METITYLNIKVEGVPYTKILSLHIQNAINGYGSAYIEGEIDSEKEMHMYRDLLPTRLLKSQQPQTDSRRFCLWELLRVHR